MNWIDKLFSDQKNNRLMEKKAYILKCNFKQSMRWMEVGTFINGSLKVKHILDSAKFT